MFLTKITEPEAISDLLDEALKDYDAGDRISRLNWLASDYFRHVDKRACQQGQVVTYISVCSDEDETPIGFARFTLEEALPGYQPLPTDNLVICLDEIFIGRPFRGRGVFPVLVHAVRVCAVNMGAKYVYARVVNRGLAKAFAKYGMGPLPLLVGSLEKLRLPTPDKLAADSGDWCTLKGGDWMTRPNELIGTRKVVLDPSVERYGFKKKRAE